MGFGLGNFFSDLVGQSNIDAAKKAFESSRFKKSIDDVSDAASDTYNDLSYTANAIGDRYNAAKAAADARVAAEIAADNRGLPTTSQQALGDASADFLPGAPILNKGVTAMKGLGGRVLHPGSKAAKQAEGMVQLGNRDLNAVRNMTQDAGDIAVKQANAGRNVYGQDMTRNQFAQDDIARAIAQKEASNAFAAKQAIDNANKAATIPQSAWDAIRNTDKRGLDALAAVNAKR